MYFSKLDKQILDNSIAVFVTQDKNMMFEMIMATV